MVGEFILEPQNKESTLFGMRPFVCYNFRHTYATDALANGVPAAQVAELLGHASIRMVETHYGHLGQKVGHMRDAARRAAT